MRHSSRLLLADTGHAARRPRRPRRPRRAAGVVDPDALDHARQAIAGSQDGVVTGSARAARAFRASAVANPDLRVAALARELGLTVSSVRAVLRAGTL